MAITLLAAACGGDDTTDTTGDGTETTIGESPDTTAAGGDSPDTTATGGETADEPWTMRVASVESLDNWDPLAQANPSYMTLVYDNLVRFAPDGVTLQPRLATEWEQTPEYLEFKLREDAFFHDGTPIDAEAVKLNLDRMKDVPSRTQSSYAFVSDVEVVDDFTVRMNFSEPTGGVLEELAGYAGSIIAPAAIEEDSYGTPIGSGEWMYNADETVPGSSTVVDAFADHYNAEEVGPDRIVYLEVFEAEQRYNALVTGEADVIYGTGALADRAEADGYDVSVYSKVQWSVMLTDIEDTFSDPNVRQAVCHAIDPQQFLDAQFDGYGTVYDQPFPEGGPGYAPEVEDSIYDYDLDAASSLMEAAGDPSIELTLPTSDEYQPASQVFASQMAEIGITVNLDVMPFGEYLGAFGAEDVPMILFSTNADQGPYAYYTRRFEPSSSLNNPGLEYPELRDLVAQGAAAESPEAANEYWVDFIESVLVEGYDCGHFGIPGFWISNPETVSNVVPTVNQIDNFRYSEARPAG